MTESHAYRVVAYRAADALRTAGILKMQYGRLVLFSTRPGASNSIQFDFSVSHRFVAECLPKPECWS